MVDGISRCVITQVREWFRRGISQSMMGLCAIGPKTRPSLYRVIISKLSVSPSLGLHCHCFICLHRSGICIAASLPTNG